MKVLNAGGWLKLCYTPFCNISAMSQSVRDKEKNERVEFWKLRSLEAPRKQNRTRTIYRYCFLSNPPFYVLKYVSLITQNWEIQ